MSDFISNLTGKLSSRGIDIKDFYNSSSLAEKRIMAEYGAVYLNADLGVIMPNRCRFASEADVTAFQSRVKIGKETVGGRVVELQKSAMDALLKAIKEVGTDGEIKPVGKNPSRRSFETVQSSWDEEVLKSADYWTRTANAKGKKLSKEQAAALKRMTGEKQIERVFELEEAGFSFHPARNRSIAVYTAIPGASQHLLMLALDIDDFGNKKMRDALGANGWFRTVYRDRPHYTYLGLKRTDLPSLGLVMKEFDNKEFWVPKM